jgi:hypothetical protein
MTAELLTRQHAMDTLQTNFPFLSADECDMLLREASGRDSAQHCSRTSDRRVLPNRIRCELETSVEVSIAQCRYAALAYLTTSHLTEYGDRHYIVAL